MLEDFVVRAFLAGLGVAVVAGPLGCFVVWRRMAYFGDTMAHAALLGVALAIALEIDLTIGVFAIVAAAALTLVVLERRLLLSTDALLGILAHSTLACGLVAVALMQGIRVDLIAYLFGDVLAVTPTDIALIWGGALLVLAVLAMEWWRLLAATVSAEIASAEGLDPDRARLVLVLVMAVVIAVAMKVIGILLITSLLIIPAAAARRFARGPEAMAVAAAVIGALAVAGGLAASLYVDTPSGPSVVVAALVLFLLSLPRLRSRVAAR